MANTDVIINWKVMEVLENWPPINAENAVFSISPNTGLFSQFSLPLNLSYIPQVLSPTITFHQVIRNLLKQKLGVVLEENKFPYKIFVPIFETSISLNLQIRLFQPNILSITVSCSSVSTTLDAKKLIEFQRLEHLRPISDIVQWTIGLVETLDQKNFSTLQPFRYKPALFLNGVCAPEEFPSQMKNNASKYVGILIRNEQFDLMDHEITERVIQKNKNHNLKSSQEILLMDKQGLLYVTPLNTKSSNRLSERFWRAHDLFEIALVYDAFLKNYRMLRTTVEDFADFLYYKIQAWIDEHDVIFSNSVTNKHIWKLLVQELGLMASFRMVTNDALLSTVAEKAKYFDQFSDNWWRNKDFIYLLGKTIEESKGIDFSFLENKDLIRLVIEDYSEAKRCFASRNYKATMLLCGSIAEAILTAVVKKAELPGLDIDSLYNNYNLNMLINVARDHDLIVDKNLFSLLDPIRHYRNLIHPGVQIRKSISVDFSRARIALDTIALLIKDIKQTQ
jgi:hypothetical protein